MSTVSEKGKRKIDAQDLLLKHCTNSMFFWEIFEEPNMPMWFFFYDMPNSEVFNLGCIHHERTGLERALVYQFVGDVNIKCVEDYYDEVKYLQEQKIITTEFPISGRASYVDRFGDETRNRIRDYYISKNIDAVYDVKHEMIVVFRNVLNLLYILPRNRDIYLPYLEYYLTWNKNIEKNNSFSLLHIQNLFKFKNIDPKKKEKAKEILALSKYVAENYTE